MTMWPLSSTGPSKIPEFQEIMEFWDFTMNRQDLGCVTVCLQKLDECVHWEWSLA